MHTRNPYSHSDYEELAKAYPDLRRYLIPHPSGKGKAVNYRDDGAQRCLTQAFLFRDYGLRVDIPDDRLCPPVPNRLNYILWLEDIMHALALAEKSNGIPEHRICGLDIGTGSSAIYPLLGCSQNAHWDFVATELDEKSWAHATNNVNNNNLQSRIQILKASSEGPILAPLHQRCVDFTMCNPPFYASRDEVLQASKGKELPPSGVCTGAEVEMIADGGEVRFVGRMIEESLVSKTRCPWFTSMLGKLSSVAELVALLQKHSITNYAITEFVQGQTRRWAIAWSFDYVRLPDVISRISNPSLSKTLPARNTMTQDLPTILATRFPEHLMGMLHRIVDSTNCVHIIERLQDRLLVSATQNTWSRSARRQRKAAKGDTVMEGLTTQAKLVCTIQLLPQPVPSPVQPTMKSVATNPQEYQLQIDWVYGEDRTLFESFASHISRKALTALKESI